MVDVLALQDLEPESPAAQEGSCFSNWASLPSDFTDEH